MAMIEVENLAKNFGAVAALRQIGFAVEEGERFMLLGCSGAGKTSLLRIFAGLEKPDQGTLRLFGTDAERLLPVDRRTAMVSQDYALYPQLTVRENLAVALRRFRLDRSAKASRIDAMLGRFGIDELANRLPSQLSGGQAQRTAFAKALVVEPKILLLDEPLSQLDIGLRDVLTELIVEATQDFGVTLVMATHDSMHAMRIADRIAILHSGRLLDVGDPIDLYRRPKSIVGGQLTGVLGMNWVDSSAIPTESPLGTYRNAKRYIGFRPEDFQTMPSSRSNDSKRMCLLEFKITSVTELGFSRLATAEYHGQRVRILVESPPQVGEILSGGVPMDQLRYVDS